MCWINGIISSRILETNISKLASSMNYAIHHRWPDDDGIFFTKLNDFNVSFWQTRLSIIDLSDAGHQPMFYDKWKGAWNNNSHPLNTFDLSIVFNGEIYNHIELRKELEGNWYIFSTKSDTEVILASYLAWWTECVSRFNGMWAFCIYDPINQNFFCSRDRFGKKPFYFYTTETDFIFSSEIKWILAHQDLNINSSNNLNSDALDFYFTLGYIPSPLTIYKNVSKLESGHNLIISITDGKITYKKNQYYLLPTYEPIKNKEALIEEGKILLEDAVKIRMFSSDVPVGAFLSGWLDSSLVVAMMTKFVNREKLHTFSIGFEWKYDETEYIDIVKDAFGTNHHHEYFHLDDFEKMIDMILYHYDEPFADTSCFPTLLVSTLARKDITVSLSWDWWDEVFGWYGMYKVAVQMNMIYRTPKFLRKALFYWIPSIADKIPFISKIKEALRVSFFPKSAFYAELWSKNFYRPIVYKNWTIKALSEILEKNNWNFIQSIIDFDLIYNTLSDNFLVKVDRASMAEALEVRSPFLDYRVIDFSRKIPTKWKVTLFQTKILMRLMMQWIVPDKIINRWKKGFTPPINEWITQDKYKDEIWEAINFLTTNEILDINWRCFFNEIPQDSNDTHIVDYQIRLFIFYRWYKKWIT